MRRLQEHALADRPIFEVWRSDTQDFKAKILETLLKPDVDRQLCFNYLIQSSRRLGCVALILGEGDEAARQHFCEGAEYGRKLLTASSLPWRTHEIQMRVSEKGAQVTAIHEHPERGPRPRPLTDPDYHRALLLIASFGTADAVGEIASFPEESYRSPEVISPSWIFPMLRGYKAWLRGEEGEAKREAEAALQTCDSAVSRPELAAFLAMATGDATSFSRRLEERLSEHKKQYAKKRSDPEGVVCFPALMLCRMALERDLAVEDGPYVPVRLLPNYRPAMH